MAKDMKKTILLLLLFLPIPLVFAEIDSYNATYTVSLSRVFVSENIELPAKGYFDATLPKDAGNVIIKADEAVVNNSGRLYGKSFAIEYDTGAFVERKNFLAEFTANDGIKKLSLRVFIPANAVLASSYDAKTGMSESIFPKASKLETDGQRIIVVWEREDFEKGNSLPVLVKFREKPDYSFVFYILAVLVVFFALYIKFRKPRIKTRTIVKKEDLLERHLKADEEQIVNILKQRENQCEQGTLRVITGFSKAKLSGLLKELEERKIIHKELRGKKNLIFLKKQ
jgi:uncharacterized membrane protein